MSHQEVCKCLLLDCHGRILPVTAISSRCGSAREQWAAAEHRLFILKQSWYAFMINHEISVIAVNLHMLSPNGTAECPSSLQISNAKSYTVCALQ